MPGVFLESCCQKPKNIGSNASEAIMIGSHGIDELASESDDPGNRRLHKADLIPSHLPSPDSATHTEGGSSHTNHPVTFHSSREPCLSEIVAPEVALENQ